MTIAVTIKNEDTRPDAPVTAVTYYQPTSLSEKSREIGSVVIRPGESKLLYVSHDTHIAIFEGTAKGEGDAQA